MDHWSVEREKRKKAESSLRPMLAPARSFAAWLRHQTVPASTR
jgi:hypothetical protein